MKKLMMVVMAFVMTMSMGVNTYAKEIGEYEKDQILKGNFEMVDLNKKATLSEWSEPDLFGNQYRLYTYTVGEKEEIVCLRHHCTREEAKRIKAAGK